MRGPFGLQDPDPSAGVVKTSLKTNITINGTKRGRVGGSFGTVDGSESSANNDVSSDRSGLAECHWTISPFCEWGVDRV